MTIYIFKRFTVRCTIWEKRGRNIIKVIDKGRVFWNDKGEIYFRFKNKKRNSVPVGREYITNVENQKKGYDLVNFYSPSQSLYFPFKISQDLEIALNSGNVEDVENIMPPYILEMIKEIENPEKVKIPVNEKIEQWFDWESFRIYKNIILTDFKGTLEKYLPHIMLIIMILLVAVASYIIMGGMEKIVARTADLEQSYITLNGRYLDITDRIVTLVEQGKIPITLVEKPPPI